MNLLKYLNWKYHNPWLLNHTTISAERLIKETEPGKIISDFFKVGDKKVAHLIQPLNAGNERHRYIQSGYGVWFLGKQKPT